MTIQQIDKMWSLSKRICQHIPLTLLLLLLNNFAPAAHCFPDQGKWDFIMNHNVQSVTVPKSLFAGSEIYVTITCDSKPTPTNISIAWMLMQSKCWQDSFMTFENVVPRTFNDTYIEQPEVIKECSNGGHIIMYPLPEYHSANRALDLSDGKSRMKRTRDQLLLADESHPIILNHKPKGDQKNNPIYTIQADGVYLFALIIRAANNKDYNASVHIEMRGTYGFLSAVDYPLLPFYGVMCLIYVLFGVIWLMVSFMQWRDLLRIQFWIGGVILLGMLEKAMFYAEYQSINSTGVSVRGAVLLAEWVSCAKRTLARMLVIIVSLGFGIVKPRLGPMLHRVVGTGGLYFVLAGVESYLRVMNIKSDPNNQILVARYSTIYSPPHLQMFS